MSKSILKENSKSGIDTIGVTYNTNIDIECFKNLKGALDKYTLNPAKGKLTLVLKPSIAINQGKELTSFKETLTFIEQIEFKFNLEKGMLKRIDLSVDILENYGDKKKVFRLLLECLGHRRKGTGVFETKKPINQDREAGNLKISSKRLQTSFYDCSDKVRIGNFRFENRILDIQTLDNIGDRALYELKKYREELQGLEEYLSSVEDDYILFLVKEYKKTVAIGKGFRTFTSFIEWADFEGLILTERILREVLIEVGITKNLKSFLNNFRSTRAGTLKFTGKKELKELINLLRSKLKELQKTF